MVAISRHLLSFWRAIAVFVLIAVCITATAHADSYSVNAIVPYPTPTQVATVDGSPDGTTVNAALQTFTGSCQLQNPADVVTVWRNGASIGSAPCNGTYSVQVMLQPGDNVLTMRTVNATGQYGPDTAPFTITLVLPPDPTPPPTPEPPVTPQNQTPAEVTASTNAGASENLTATTVEPFSVLSTNNDVTINVTVGGGQTPYTITLDWGDGSSESHSVDQAGTYAFTHNYLASGNYTVRGSVHDVLGASTQFSYAVVSGVPTPGTQTAPKATAATTSNAVADFFAHHWKPVAGTTGAITVAGAGYLVGVHKAVGQAVVQTTRAVRPRIKRLPKVRK